MILKKRLKQLELDGKREFLNFVWQFNVF